MSADSEKQRPIVVTGLGPLSCLGAGTGELWRSLRTTHAPSELRAPLYDPATEGVATDPFPLFLVDSETRDACLSERDRREIEDDPELRLALAALRLAMDDAGGLSDESLARAGLVLTWEAPGLDRLQRGIARELEAERVPETNDADAKSRFREFYERHREAFYGTHSFLHLHLIARALGLHGPTHFANNACASGLYALDAAAGMIERGQADLVLVAAAECPRFPTKMLWFEELSLYALDGRVRPFDRDRTGVVFGEAGAALVLETRENAEAHGRRPIAEYLGTGVNQEAWKVAVPDLSGGYYDDALRRACSAAGIEPSDLDVVNVHGAATGLSDLYEAQGLTTVFGEWPTSPEILAIKALFGHTLGASALLELCALLLCLDHDWLPASPGFESPDDRLRVAPRSESGDARCDLVLKMSNGFAGFNAGSVFRKSR